ncbi:MAG: hypothetical protein KF745_05400 [Phycisphaeraceae bacterium]|nr:hypothetical protein [Phycisphaeraceae bacterium]
MADEQAHPYHPIVYVRGYAGTQHAIEEATSDPYMGLNAGSCRLRQLWTGDVVRHFFESPLVRLMKEHGYLDVFNGGEALAMGRKVPARSVVIYRYYDTVSRDFGDGSDGEIEGYARGLARLILDVRDRVGGGEGFRVYLVAHSMGGLICRCMLQNGSLGGDEAERRVIAEARGVVDKVFTYATPHDGIDLRLLGNVPGLLSTNHVDTFNRERMARYLGLPAGHSGSVATLNGAFDPERFFCLVGTNDRDYEVAMGMSRRVVGPMSDGLVKIENACVSGRWEGQERHSPRAFVHRSHSGPYGITNSEEGYQNMVRFLFGDVRVDGELEVSSLTLPPEVEKKRDEGRRIRASYHFETVVRVRGAMWDLHRRVTAEGSASFAAYDELLVEQPGGGRAPGRRPHLFSTYLSCRSRVNTERVSLGFSVDLGVLVPQYECDGFLMFRDHYDGGYLFRDKINIEAIPPEEEGGEWRLRYGYDSKTPNRTSREATGEAGADGRIRFRIPVQQRTRPGIEAVLVLTARAWNEV